MPGVKGLCGQWAGGREWSAVDKGMLPVVLLIPVFVSYLGWVDYAQGRPDRDLLIDVAAAQSLRTALWAMLAGALALTALGLLLRRYRPALMLFQYLGTGFYAATMAYCGYVVGSLSFAAGIVALGAPLAGFILLERRPVLFGMAIAFTFLLLASYASATGSLPYAPLMRPPADTASHLFWLGSNYVMALPHIVIILLLADRALSGRRAQEAAIGPAGRSDMLTGVHNRRGILELLDREIARSKRHGPPLALVLLELDHFKRGHDTWGRPSSTACCGRRPSCSASACASATPSAATAAGSS